MNKVKGTSSSQSSELDHILRHRREVSDELLLPPSSFFSSSSSTPLQPPPPPPPRTPRSASSSGNNFSRKSWKGFVPQESPTRVSPQQFSPKFNDSFITQSLDTLDFNTSSSDSLNDWNWDQPMKIPSLDERQQQQHTFTPDFSIGHNIDGFTNRSKKGDDMEEELVQDEECESISMQDLSTREYGCTKASFYFHSFPILSESTTKVKSTKGPFLKALAHPFNGNIILCRLRRPRNNQRERFIPTEEEWFIDEIDPTCSHSSMVVTSTPILSFPLVQSFTSRSNATLSSQDSTSTISTNTDWNHKRPIGLKQVVHITCGVESRKNSSAQVVVAAILDLIVVSHSFIKMKKEDIISSSSAMSSAKGPHNSTVAHAIQDIVRVIAVWEQSTNYGSAMVLRQVLPPPSSGNFLYDPYTLALADGILFLGGSMKGYPYIFSLSLFHALVPWSCTSVTTRVATGLDPCDTSLPLASSFPSKVISQTVDEKLREEEGAGDTSTLAATRVVALACTLHRMRQYKYLAVALDNGDMCIMTYHSPRKYTSTATHGKALHELSTNDSAESSLQLLVMLHGHSSLNKSDTPHLMENTDNYQEPSVRLEYTKNYCTQLAWLFPGSSCNNLPLLVAAFTNGVLIYLVSLKYAKECDVMIESSHPVREIKSTKDTTSSASPFRKKAPFHADSASQLSSIETYTATKTSKSLFLLPLYTSRIFDKDIEKRIAHPCYVAWLDMGSRFPPSLSILCVDLKKHAHLILTSLNMDNSSRPNRIVKLCCKLMGAVEQNNVGLISSTGFCSVFHVVGNSITAFVPTLLKDRQEKGMLNRGLDPFFAQFTKPVTSPALGINSKGCVTQDSIDDFVLHIFSSIQCNKGDGSKGDDTPEARLYMKHYLCLTTFGDRKSEWVDNEKSESKSINTWEPTEGASCRLFQDLSCHNLKFHLRPEKISLHKHWGAVLFSRESETSESEGAIYIIPRFVAIFNISKMNKSISDQYEVYEGRDVSFFSSGNKPTALIVNATGHYITQMIHQENRWIRVRSFAAPFLGNYSIHRIHILTTGKVICSGYDESFQNHLYSAGTVKLSENSSSFNFYRVKKAFDMILVDSQESIDQLIEVREDDDSEDRGHLINASTLFHIITMRVLDGKLQLLCKVCKQSRGSLASIGNQCFAHLSSASVRPTRLEYTSNLKGVGSRGTIATFPISPLTDGSISLLALRPDRFIYLNEHSFSDLSGENNISDAHGIPQALTRPTCPLEPLISSFFAKHLIEGTSKSISSLQNITEKFSKQMHVDNGMVQGHVQEPFGKGMTYTCLSMLSRHGCSDLVENIGQSSGLSKAHTSSIHIPRWTQNQETSSFITIGDFDHCNRIKKTPIPFPLPPDPSSIIARLRANGSFKKKQVTDAVAHLEFAGDFSSDEVIFLLIHSPGITNKKSAKSSIRSEHLTKYETRIVSENNDPNRESFTQVPSYSPLASLSNHLKLFKENINRRSELTLSPIIRRFSFSYQRGLNTLLRSRNGLSSLVTEVSNMQLLTQDKSMDARDESIKKVNDGKCIWYTGPFEDKEKLLQLHHFEHWLGCRFLPVLGKEGVDTIAGAGDRLLASLVLADMNPMEEYVDDNISHNASKCGWIDGVGEGRNDEENLTLYLRFSEGVEENRPWVIHGFQDLSQYNNSVFVFGQDNLSLQKTSSSVDEGEEGKVKLLFDLVFDGSDVKTLTSFIYIEVRRGSSLDVGCLHSSNNHESRQRGSLEFWYYCPEELAFDDIVLARRSVCVSGKSIQSLLDEPIENHLLWELVLLSNGLIIFRTQSGSLSCPTHIYRKRSCNEIDDDSEVPGTESDESPVYHGWNHVCVTFNSRNMGQSVSQVSLFMKGVLRASSPISFDLPSFHGKHDRNSMNIDEILDHTFLLFGLRAHSGFRMTELRHWACERSADDTKMMMYEYLSQAETRRKLQVKIRNKHVRSKSGSVNNSLAPPRSSRLNEFSNSYNPTSIALSIVNTATSRPSEIIRSNTMESILTINKDPISSTFETVENKSIDGSLGYDSNDNKNSMARSINVKYSYELSKYMKTSIATAIVRGPSITNHFGGNNGGFSSLLSKRPREMVPHITICGTEKTVIFSCDETPTATTYPIGAAGAILWKENGSEYLACYQAKDKRIIVFDLKTNTEIVELQMTLKLMFWRYLPPTSHGENVTIILVTSSGGFHFLPLDESPRPRQAFGKDSCLQGKKVEAYEEGGSNGKLGKDLRSTVALLLLSTQKSSLVEAHGLLLFESLPQASLCISTDVLGAALFSPADLSDVKDPTLPFVITASLSELSDYEFTVEVFALAKGNDGSLIHGNSLTRLLVPKLLQNKDDDFRQEISSFLGLSPTVLCLCCNDHVAFVQRPTGNLFIYKYSGHDHSLSFIGFRCFHAYVADATVMPSANSHGKIEISVLLGGQESTKHGLISVIQI